MEANANVPAHRRKDKKKLVTDRTAERRAQTREVNKALKRATKVTSTGSRGAQKQLVKNIAASGRVHVDSALMVWAKLLADPFNRPSAFCPVNYNPAPSFIQSLARTTSTNLNLAVAASTCTQICLWPGHANPPDSNSAAVTGDNGMDAVSYHAQDVRINSTVYVVGPMTKADNISTKAPIIGVVTSALALGSANGAMNTAGRTAMTYDVGLPYVSSTQSGAVGGAHSRWQLVSMGIRIHNITPEIQRGGTIVSVQPNNSYNLPGDVNQSTFEAYPTFHDWGVGDGDGVEISWIPRAQDMAFWHGQENLGAGSAIDNIKSPAMFVWLNAGSTAQTYSYEVVGHWQLAGSYLNPIGGPASHYPDLKPTAEKTISVLTNGHPSSTMAPRIVQAVHSDDGSKSSGYLETLGHLKDAVLRAAGTAGAAYVHTRRAMALEL